MTVPEDPLKPPSETPSNFIVLETFETTGSVTQKSIRELVFDIDCTEKNDEGNDINPETALKGTSDVTTTFTITLLPTSKVPLDGSSESVAACAKNGETIKSKKNISIETICIFIFLSRE
jgi:hypothetical protein